jgi:hypothetical protein
MKSKTAEEKKYSIITQRNEMRQRIDEKCIKEGIKI